MVASNPSGSNTGHETVYAILFLMSSESVPVASATQVLPNLRESSFGSASHCTTSVDHLGLSLGSCDTLMSLVNVYTDVQQVS